MRNGEPTEVEYFNGSDVGARFQTLIEDFETVLVPTICVAEVVRHALRHRGRDDALAAAGGMILCPLIELDANLALFAAETATEHGLPLADAIIYASARVHDAILWTLDTDFRGLPKVELVPRDG